MEDKKSEVLIIGGDDYSMEIAETLAETSDVVVVDSDLSHVGIGGHGAAMVEALSMAILAEPYMMHSPFSSGLRKLMRPNKEMKKCLLPSCQKLTSHNSGYCSKECKVENQYKLKK